MFKLFKRKTQAEKLYDSYKRLMKEAHALSATHRKLSDEKTFEADQVMKQIEALEK